MSKIRIVVNDTNNNFYYGPFEEIDSKQLEELNSLFEDIDKFEYVTLDTEWGNKVYIRGEHIVSALIEYSGEEND